MENVTALSSLRDIVGPDPSDDDLISLLKKEQGDVSAAAEQFFENQTDKTTIASSGSLNSLPTPKSLSITSNLNALDISSLKSLKELLGNDVPEAEMIVLLKKSHDDVSAAVDLYFCEKAKSAMDASSTEEYTQIVIDSPPPIPISANTTTDSSRLHANEEYEVELTDGVLNWTIGNVLGRIVVQDVVVGGAAHRANIQKADVLIECSGHPIQENNVSPIVTRLSKEVVNVPVCLRFRRADHSHGVQAVDSSIKSPVITEEVAVKEDFGLKIMAEGLDSMSQTAGDEHTMDSIIQHYLWSEGNVPLAMDQIFQPVPLFPDFTNVVGRDWYSNDGKVNHANPEWPLYDASFPTGPMGITVENIHERTIVVNVKDGTSAARANVSVDSWLVAVNGECITHLTHRETLHMIHNLPRPLLMTFCVTPGSWLPTLKQNMDVNIRLVQSSNPLERRELFVPDNDRTSFKRFHRKFKWALQVFPSVACQVIFNSLQNSKYYPSEVAYSIEEPTDICPARLALRSLLQNMENELDKGEKLVCQLIKGISVLALWCCEDIDSHESKWWLLNIALDLFENGSVMEKNSTWDAIVDALKGICNTLPPSKFIRVIPQLIARLSYYSSPSSRILPLVLLPLAYPHVEGDLCVQLRGLFERLAADDAPLVRRAAAYSLPALAGAVGHKSMAWSIHSLDKLCKDHSELVRLYAIQAIDSFGSILTSLDEETLRLTRCQLLPLINTFVSDSEWQVRHQTVQSIPQLVNVLGKEYTDVLVDHFVELAGDSNMEVRIAASKSAFPLSLALSTTSAVKDAETNSENIVLHSKVILSILPSYFSLSKDPCASVRRAVATALGPAIALLGENETEVLDPMIRQLISDKDALVCQLVVEQLANESAYLPEELEELLVQHIEKLSKARQWRSRLLALESIQKWTSKIIPPTLVMISLGLLEDTVCQVRVAAVAAVVRVTELQGSEWLVTTGLSPILGLLDGSFQLQLTGLDGIRGLVCAKLIPRDQLDLVVDRLVLAATQSKTCNIREKALAILLLIATSNQVDASKWSLVRPALEESFQREENFDVLALHGPLLEHFR